MEMSDEHRGRIAVHVAIRTALLVDGLYDLMASMSSRELVSSDELRHGVESLGQPIIEPPQTEWRWQPAATSRETDSTAFDLEVPFWTADGRSELGLKLHLVETPVRTFDVEIRGFCALNPHGVFDTDRPHPVSTRPSTGPPAMTAPTSDEPIPQRWRPTLTAIVHRLVIGDYAGLARDGLVALATGPTDDSIGTWIEDYPLRLVDLPPDAWAYSERGATVDPGCWWIVVGLWDEEGPSDLSMEGTVWDDGTNITVKINTVHVM